jgi:hypothetical protein
MIIVSEDTIPVACYDDLSPKEALQAYISDYIPLSNMSNISINKEGSATLVWQRKRYDAAVYLENF